MIGWEIGCGGIMLGTINGELGIGSNYKWDPFINPHYTLNMTYF